MNLLAVWHGRELFPFLCASIAVAVRARGADRYGSCGARALVVLLHAHLCGLHDGGTGLLLASGFCLRDSELSLRSRISDIRISIDLCGTIAEEVCIFVEHEVPG